MNWLFAVSGVILLVITWTDIIKTTLTLQGAGPVTTRMAELVWKAVFIVFRITGTRNTLARCGPAIAILTVAVWILLEWTAWSLIVFADPSAVVSSQGGQQAGAWDRVYYAGYSFFTLGLGDYQPKGALWQVITNLMSATGFLTISLCATYLVPIVSAVVSKRKVAIYIGALGRTPQDVLITGWNGNDFSGLQSNLSSLASPIMEIGQQHLAYPILHYYYAARREESLALQMVVLDQALMLMEVAVAPEARLPKAIMAPAVAGARSFLDSLERVHIKAAAEAPPLPSLEPLRSAGIPVVSDQEFQEAMERKSRRRKLSQALLENSGWAWQELSWPGQPRDGTLLQQ
ncbi:two pore domain potassium channel family protein [Indioceanicola profundi]|uniref:two pore domain potassium channel family protein n=1 Tax=Indioceanicola profundi TaxID=2220096 RepID=UPI0013C4AFA3|nr:two pore domain potassium channel family protein [Indioceanicola profundi]